MISMKNIDPLAVAAWPLQAVTMTDSTAGAYPRAWRRAAGCKTPMAHTPETGHKPAAFSQPQQSKQPRTIP
jgi:hypothetical protein